MKQSIQPAVSLLVFFFSFHLLFIYTSFFLLFNSDCHCIFDVFTIHTRDGIIFCTFKTNSLCSSFYLFRAIERKVVNWTSPLKRRTTPEQNPTALWKLCDLNLFLRSVCHCKKLYACIFLQSMDVKTGPMHYAYSITDLKCLLVSLRKCKNVKSCEFILLSLLLVFHGISHKRFSGSTSPVLW